jgi:hypothetical protein
MADYGTGESMNAPYSDARPPRWAEATLRVLLKPRDRETISGDLLEEYRDTIVPTRGPTANWWYIRQVAWYLLRASWVWGALMGAALVIRYLLDTLVPPADYWMRATVLSWTILAACMLAGFVTSWRTRSMRAGVLASSTAATMGAMISIVGAATLLAVWHDPATLAEWRRSGGLDEAFVDVPLKIVALGITLGSIGAALGKGVTTRMTLGG